MNVKILVHEVPQDEGGGYWAEVPALPGCRTQGDSWEELMANLHEVVEGWLLIGAEWKLMHDGVLTAEPSKLDGRQKLIPREQVEALLQEEGYRPRRTVRPKAPGASGGHSEGVGTGSRPWPQSIGMVSDGTLPSSESETYMRKQIHGEPVDAE